MEDITQWDWSPGTKEVAAIGQWGASYEWVEELTVSPDGEQIAAVVKTGETEYNVCVNGQTYENAYDKIWRLRFAPDGRLMGHVSDTGEWTMAIDGVAWDNAFEFVWDSQLPAVRGPVFCAAKSGQDYFSVKDGVAWENTYRNLSGLVASPDGGHSAAVVQTVQFSEAEIFRFKEGCYSVAVDGQVWSSNFVNAWDLAFAPDGTRVAAVVRITLYDYTIAVDGVAWPRTYTSVWRPIFGPDGRSVMAPVKTAAGWTLARDGEPFWTGPYTQLWHPQSSHDGRRVAAIVAPRFGRWTVAVDDVPWKQTFGDCVTDLSLSADGEHIACVGIEKERHAIVVDGRPWPGSFDRAWKPVFSADGGHVAAKVERDGRKAILLDGHALPGDFHDAWSPVFSPDGHFLLVRGIEGAGRDACYRRKVIPINTINGGKGD